MAPSTPDASPVPASDASVVRMDAVGVMECSVRYGRRRAGTHAGGSSTSPLPPLEAATLGGGAAADDPPAVDDDDDACDRGASRLALLPATGAAVVPRVSTGSFRAGIAAAPPLLPPPSPSTDDDDDAAAVP
jgi:hypothetical protein